MGIFCFSASIFTPSSARWGAMTVLGLKNLEVNSARGASGPTSSVCSIVQFSMSPTDWFV